MRLIKLKNRQMTGADGMEDDNNFEIELMELFNYMGWDLELLKKVMESNVTYLPTHSLKTE